MLAPLLMNTCLLLSLKSRYLEPLQFEVGNLQETSKSSQETIAALEEANAMLREQLDDLEQYTRRTNIRIFGIPEPTGTDPEDTDAKVLIGDNSVMVK